MSEVKKFVSTANDLNIILNYLASRPVSEVIQKTGVAEAVDALRRAVPLETELKAHSEAEALKAAQDAVKDAVKAAESGTSETVTPEASQAV